VLQPAWNSQGDEHERPGPFLQVDLFEANGHPPPDEIAAFAAAARGAFRA
jgi:hypothetical protein